MWNILISVSLDIISQKLESCLVCLDWIGQIVGVNFLGLLPEERSNSLDAGRTLHILTINELVKILFHVCSLWRVFDVDFFKDSQQNGLESLEVPVLVDDLVDHASLENLMDLVGEQVHQIVHVVDGLSILHVFAAPLWQQLLSHQENEIFHVWVQSELDAFLWKLEAHLDFVEHWPKH
jgi:hypothetical protein